MKLCEPMPQPPENILTRGWMWRCGQCGKFYAPGRELLECVTGERVSIDSITPAEWDETVAAPAIKAMKRMLDDATPADWNAASQAILRANLPQVQ